MFELADTLVGIYKTRDNTKTMAIEPQRLTEMIYKNDQGELEEINKYKRGLSSTQSKAKMVVRERTQIQRRMTQTQTQTAARMMGSGGGGRDKTSGRRILALTSRAKQEGENSAVRETPCVPKINFFE